MVNFFKKEKMTLEKGPSKKLKEKEELLNDLENQIKVFEASKGVLTVDESGGIQSVTELLVMQSRVEELKEEIEQLKLQIGSRSDIKEKSENN